MRIVPVTGDLPALALPPPAPTTVTPPAAAAPSPPPVAAAAAAERGSGSGTGAERRHSGGKAYFDPPLIAQRAVLGLPVGPLVAEYAREEGVDLGAAWAAVEREMPEPQR